MLSSRSHAGVHKLTHEQSSCRSKYDQQNHQREGEEERESGIPHLMLEWKLVEKIHEIKHNSDSRGHKLTKMYTYTT